MSVSESQRAASNKWDKENMAYQTVKVRKTLLDNFKATCAARGDKVNTVLRKAMECYVENDGYLPWVNKQDTMLLSEQDNGTSDSHIDFMIETDSIIEKIDTSAGVGDDERFQRKCSSYTDIIWHWESAIDKDLPVWHYIAGNPEHIMELDAELSLIRREVYTFPRTPERIARIDKMIADLAEKITTSR